VLRDDFSERINRVIRGFAVFYTINVRVRVRVRVCVCVCARMCVRVFTVVIRSANRIFSA
jgi:hypothetical protein